MEEGGVRVVNEEECSAVTFTCSPVPILFQNKIKFKVLTAGKRAIVGERLG